MSDVVTNAVSEDAFRGKVLSERFRVLTPRQQVFVLAYLGNGDALASVQRAFECTNERSANIRSYAVLQNKRVADCISEFLGKSDREIAIDALRRELRKSKPGSYNRARFMSMYLRLTGLLTEAEAAAEEKAELVAKPKRSVGRPRKDSQPLFTDAPNADQSVLNVNDDAAPKPRFKVGDLCMQDGQKFLVTSVDVDGQPLTADEVK